MTLSLLALMLFPLLPPLPMQLPSPHPSSHIEKIAKSIPREVAISALKGECLSKKYHQNVDPLLLTNSLILHLGIIPPSHLIELHEEIPPTHKHLSIVSHNGHHPFRPQRLIGEVIKPITFCKE